MWKNWALYTENANTRSGRTPLIRAPIGFYAKIRLFKAGQFHKGRTYIWTHLWGISPEKERLFEYVNWFPLVPNLSYNTTITKKIQLLQHRYYKPKTWGSDVHQTNCSFRHCFIHIQISVI